MGIKDLWTILQPFSERKPLSELQGKKVSIDLSGWVCQAQHIQEPHNQAKMYLRNLYFRTCCLLLQDIHPIFTLEGKAPTLKKKTMEARRELHFKAKTKSGDMQRSYLTRILNCCADLLEIVGIKCIEAKGEAEALCAHLNRRQLVAGCISQDSDCFAYGASTVFRNFSITNTSSNGAMDVYDLNAATRAIGLGRNKIVALALLTGCDYNDGVSLVGKDSVMKLFNEIDDDHILVRLKSWQRACQACNVKAKKFCAECVKNYTKIELNVRTKAAQVDNFPDQELIDEFLIDKDDFDHLEDLEWNQPNLIAFIKFSKHHLLWDEIYSFEKSFPLLTRWMVLKSIRNGPIQPEYIKKRRNPKGVPSYEIIWDCSKLLAHIPTEQKENVDLVKLCSTIEPADLINAKYPQLVELYEESKRKPTKTKRGKRATKTTKPTKPKSPKLMASQFDDDEFDVSLTEIVNGITEKPLPLIIRSKINDLVDTDDANVSFFIDKCTKHDLFEESFNQLIGNCSSGESSDDEDDEGDLIERVRRRINHNVVAL